MAVSIVLWPAHKLVSVVAIVTVPAVLIVSIMESAVAQPVTLSVMVTLYLVVPATGVTVGLAAVALLRFVVGVQLYFRCPDPPDPVGDAPRLMGVNTGRQ